MGQPAASAGAANALQAWDMLHGNLLLRGWTVSDVSFYTTELPEYMGVELIRGLGSDVVHVAALTYTLLVLLAGLLATTSPFRTVELFQSGSSRVEDTTTWAGCSACPPGRQSGMATARRATRCESPCASRVPGIAAGLHSAHPRVIPGGP